MKSEPRAGQRVAWRSHGGEAEGKVVRKLISPTKIKSHKVAARRESPEFLVRTREGGVAAHKAEALKKSS
jgi:hypothetical protein